MELIQGAAATLVRGLDLTHEEAIELIVRGLRSEMAKRQISLEALDIRPRAERTAFIRNVVKTVQDEIAGRHIWPKSKIETVVMEFMHILHDSWLGES